MKIEMSHCDIAIEEKMILKDINLEIRDGDFLRIAGRNGSGKTLFINSLLGIHQEVTGTINRVFDKKDIAYVTESPFFLDDDKVDEVLMTLAFFYSTKVSVLRELLKVLDFDITEDKRKKISDLSKGMRKKLLLVPILLETSCFLVLDEIFTGLDAVVQEKLIAILTEKHQKGSTIIMIEHNEMIISQLRQKIRGVKQVICQNQTISLDF